MENVQNVEVVKELKVTPISELVSISQGELVELPPFDDTHPFVARLKRPSMLAMARSGKIPNSLLIQANNLFANGASQALQNDRLLNNKESMAEMFSIMDSICQEAFIEPTYQELKDNNITLTDEQMLSVFSYTQRGIKSLENFR